MHSPKAKTWHFDPVVQTWFDENFDAATPCQQLAWPAVQQGRDVLVSAPTGSGKTLAAFLAVINDLVQRGIKGGGLPDETLVVYVSPLKALSYDIERNLEAPLQGIRQKLTDSGYPDFEIRTGVRTGDTTSSERQKMIRKPPHILVTTPESFYLLLTAESGRKILGSATRLIVDEIHALAGNKRGAHFSLSIARFERLVQGSPVKIGLSATQKPLDQISSYLTGRSSNDCVIVDTGHVRVWDLDIVVPKTPLEAVISTAAWADIYLKIADLIQQHRTTLIFVNTRRHVERATRQLAEMLGEEHVGSHHGSLSKEHRHKAEQDLKAGVLKALVATASLELGIDIGDVDLVCQIGSARSISVFLQRVGRSGHAIDRTPKGRIFPTTRDELVESVALLKTVNDGHLESLEICTGALDVLAQQIVAETCVRDCAIDDLYQSLKSAYPYRNLAEDDYHAIVRMLAEGFTFRRGRRNAYIHLDAVNRMLRARKGTRIVASTNAGAIPDLFDYDVILEPDDIRIGTVNEDFAFESLVGDIFQLGNTSYRVLSVAKGYVRVEDAKGLAPNIPFWVGEGRGRSDLLSRSVSNLRDFVQEALNQREFESVVNRFSHEYSVNESIARQIVFYLHASIKALGLLPNQRNIVFERFFDETGDAHLVVHSVYGSRVNKAWGLALRKRFCVRFNFELQAAALEDNFILSLGPTHSFALEEVQNYVKSASAKDVLRQAVLGAPMFATRWRWVANTALAVLRFNLGKKVPPPFQRNDSEDLLSLIFPDQVACQENVTGPIEVPDHPLVQQTMTDCLEELMDTGAFVRLLKAIEAGNVAIVCRDVSEPSPLAHEVLTAKPYAFLDDAPAEERRALAVQSRRITGLSDIQEFGKFDFELMRSQNLAWWPKAKDAEQLHDALVNSGFFSHGDPLFVASKYGSMFMPDHLEPKWRHFLDELIDERRATVLKLSSGAELWIAAERLHEIQLVYPDAELTPVIEPATFGQSQVEDSGQSLIALLRSRLSVIGPCTATQICMSLELPVDEINMALQALESEGAVMQGRFMEGTADTQWCERNYLARLHKAAISVLRNKVKPVDKMHYKRYLAKWMNLNADSMGEGVESLSSVLEMLEGYEAPAAVWESDILPARNFGYTPELLDHLNATGRFLWCRLSMPDALYGQSKANRKLRQRMSIRSIPLTFLRRNQLKTWKFLADRQNHAEPKLSGMAALVVEALTELGPLFFDEILEDLSLLPTHVEECLIELFSLGIVTCDHYGGIRALLRSERERRRSSRYGRVVSKGVNSSGRWSLLVHPNRAQSRKVTAEDAMFAIAMILLNRYGIVFWDLLAKEGKFMPRWSELRRVLYRLEDRGEVRTGRFVDHVAGEQFALPRAIELLRSNQSRSEDKQTMTIHSTDPYNLSRILESDALVSAQLNNYLVYRDGALIEAVENGTRVLAPKLI